MFNIHWRNRTPEQARSARRPVAGDGRFTELEGDFESERRRAESSEVHHPAPYEHDDSPRLPGGWSAVTHP